MTADRRQQLDSAAIALMVLLCACWGFNQVAIKVANAGISPIFQAGLRSAGSALLVWAWSAHRGVRLLARDGTLGLGLLIGVLFAAEFVFLYWSLVFTSASRAVLFLYMSPFVVVLGAHFLVPGERLRWLQMVGLLCAFAGIALAFGDALRFPTYRELLGDSMAFVAAILWGATTVVIKASRLARISPHKNLLYQLAVSAVLLPILSWIAGEPGIVAPTPLGLGMLAYQVIVVAFASYLAWFWLISRYPAGRLSSFSFLTPLFGLLAGALVLGEPVGWALLLALLLVGIGIALVNRPAPVPHIAAPPVGAPAGKR
ncbi:MAG TPA: DMT family transporter [Stellaceae bacterium]|nr:DMT family transporter [Stellaceae bacterium]